MIKRDFRALGRLEKGLGVQVVFSSILPIVGNDIKRNRQIQLISAWLLRGSVLMRAFMLHHDVLSALERI